MVTRSASKMVNVSNEWRKKRSVIDKWPLATSSLISGLEYTAKAGLITQPPTMSNTASTQNSQSVNDSAKTVDYHVLDNIADFEEKTSQDSDLGSLSTIDNLFC